MKKTATIGLAIVLAAAALAGQGRTSPEVQLKAAIHKEQVEGDLQGAVELFRRLAQSTNRAVAAQAWLHLGQCYEKLGDAQAVEARKAYERVVSAFADQKEQAGEAQRRLASLAPAVAGGGIRSRRVDFPNGPDVSGARGAITPDGRWLTYTKGNAVVLRDLRSGTERTVVSLKSLYELIGSTVSPDGRLIAYMTSEQTGPGDRDYRIELWVAQADGSGVRRIKVLAEREDQDVFVWTPDATRIAMTVVYNDWASARIDLTSVSDGSTITLTDKAWLWDVSPDGRWAVYEGGGCEPSAGLYVVPLSGGKPQLLVSGSALTIKNPVWTPDSSHVCYGNRRPDQPFSRNFVSDVYCVPMSDQPGKSELVARDVAWSFGTLGMTRDWDVYQFTQERTQRVYEVDIDPASGGRSGAPRAIPDLPRGFGAMWSPDGQTLAYWRPDSGPGTMTVSELMVRPAAGGPERRIWRGPNNLAGAVNKNIQWFPDGKSVLLHSFAGELSRLDVATGATTRVLPSVQVPWGSPHDSWTMPALLSPDGTTVYFVRLDKRSRQGRVMRAELSGDTETELGTFAADDFQCLTVSPDGSRLALLLQAGLRLDNPATVQSIAAMPATGGSVMEVARPTIRARAMEWSADGRRFFVYDVPPRETRIGNIWTMPVAGGPMTPLGIGLHDLYFVRVSPDGRRLILTDQEIQRTTWARRVTLPSAGK